MFLYDQFTRLEKVKKPFMWRIIRQNLSYVMEEAHVNSDLFIQNVTFFPIEIKKVSTGILDTQTLEIMLGVSTFSPPIYLKPHRIANIKLNSFSNNNNAIIQECLKNKKIKLHLYYKIEYSVHGVELFKEYFHEANLNCPGSIDISSPPSTLPFGILN